jgi:hypothetical protein
MMVCPGTGAAGFGFGFDPELGVPLAGGLAGEAEGPPASFGPRGLFGF